MLSWPLAFLIIALLSGLLGFAGIDGHVARTARALCVLFLGLFVASITLGRKRCPKEKRVPKDAK